MSIVVLRYLAQKYTPENQWRYRKLFYYNWFNWFWKV